MTAREINLDNYELVKEQDYALYTYYRKKEST